MHADSCRTLFVFLFAASAGLTSRSAAQESAPDIPPPAVASRHGFTQLAFYDDFGDGELDPRWKIPHMRENNGRIQEYIRAEGVTFASEFEENTSNERLILRAYNTYRRRNGRREIDKWIAGRIDTRTRYQDTPRGGNPANDRLIHRGFEHRYGYIESRIRFRTQSGQIAAFWLNFRRNHSKNWRGAPPSEWQGMTRQQLERQDRDFNVSYGNEIDIIEALKRHKPKSADNLAACGPAGRDGFIDASRCMIMNLHWGGGPRSENHRATGRHVALRTHQTDIIGNWHTFALLWTPQQYIFYLDGEKMWETDINTQTHLVSQRTEFIHLSTNVNDSSFSGSPPSGGFGSRADTPALMEVDWIRWWSNRVPDPNEVPPRF
jgi:hypothetical protein